MKEWGDSDLNQELDCKKNILFVNPIEDTYRVLVEGESSLQDYNDQPFLKWAMSFYYEVWKESNENYYLEVENSYFEYWFLEHLNILRREYCQDITYLPIDYDIDERYQEVDMLVEKYGLASKDLLKPVFLDNRSEYIVKDSTLFTNQPNDNDLCIVIRDVEEKTKESSRNKYVISIVLTDNNEEIKCISDSNPVEYLVYISRNNIEDFLRSIENRFIKARYINDSYEELKSVVSGEDINRLKKIGCIGEYIEVDPIPEIPVGEEWTIKYTLFNHNHITNEDLEIKIEVEKKDSRILLVQKDKQEYIIKALIEGKAELKILSAKDSNPIETIVVTVIPKQYYEMSPIPNYVLRGEQIKTGIINSSPDFERVEGEPDVTIEPAKGLTFIKNNVSEYVFNADSIGIYNVVFRTKWQTKCFNIEVIPEPASIEALVEGRSRVKLYQEPKKVTVRVEPYSQYNQKHTWKLSNTNVCKINSDDVIYPVGIGKCKLTCLSLYNDVQTELFVDVLPDTRNNKSYLNRYSVLQLFMMLVGIAACLINKYNEYTAMVTVFGAFSPPFIRWLPIICLLLVILLGVLSIMRNKKTIIISIVFVVLLVLGMIWCGSFSVL